MDNELVKELEGVGLSEKEARVYLAVLEMGQATVQEIGKKADVNRATTYVILESLMNKGLIATFGEGKKSLFIAEAPHGLNNIIREQEEELEKREAQLEMLMPEISSIYNLHPNKPEVMFYEGKEGLKIMQKDFLYSKEKEAVEFFSLSDVQSIFSKSEADEVGKRRRKNKIKITAIFTDQREGLDPTEKIKFYEDDLTTSIQLDEKEYPMESDIIVYEDKVSIASLKGHISGVIIKHKLIAETVRSIFNLAFDEAIRYKK